MSFDENNDFRDSDTINEIRNRSSEEFLESKLETVWMTKGYSKSSVKEYVNHLLKELDYQKDSFSIQMKELRDEKERLISEKAVLSKQLEDSVAALNDIDSDDEKINELQQVITNLNNELNELKKDDKANLIDKLKRQLNEANDYSNKLNQQLIEAKSKNYKNKDEEVEELLSKVNFLEKDNQKLSEELSNLNAELTMIRKIGEQGEETDVEIMQKNSLEMQNLEIERYKNDNQMLYVEMLALNRLIKDLTQRDKENEGKIVDLENFVDELKVEHHDKLKELEDIYEGEINELTENYKSLKNKFDDLKNERVVLLTERTELQGRLAAGLEYLNELYDKVDYLQSSNKVLSRQLEEQRTKNRMISGLEIPSFSGDLLKTMNRELLEIKKNNLELKEELYEKKEYSQK